MDRIIQSPGKYIQGAGAIKRLGEYLKPLAERWLIIGDKFVLGFAEEQLRTSLGGAGLVAEIAPFGGECSQNEINRLRDIASSAQCHLLRNSNRRFPPAAHHMWRLLHNAFRDAQRAMTV